MKLHEYQAKALFKEAGLQIPKGGVATTVEAVDAVFRALGIRRAVIKAQVHAGGRGKAGGIQVADTPADAEEKARTLLGSRLVTPQTQGDGQPVSAVYVEEKTYVAHEYYLAMLLDRKLRRLCVMFSTQGGMEIEEVAAKDPGAILKFHVPLSETMPGYVPRGISVEAGWDKSVAAQAKDLICKLYNIYCQKDATLIEINPLVLTTSDQLVPLDAKVVIDDSASWRQPEVQEDFSQMDPREVAAKELGLSYIHLDGSIGCMVNGAGLAMATMDLIQFHGGSPANFLDVGGSADADQIKGAFGLILKDDRVKSVLVNIFGGIMRCDVIAQGIIEATKGVDLKVPVIIRLEGTNVEEGKALLDQSRLKLFPANSLDEAAMLAVQKGGGRL